MSTPSAREPKNGKPTKLFMLVVNSAVFLVWAILTTKSDTPLASVPLGDAVLWGCVLVFVSATWREL